MTQLIHLKNSPVNVTSGFPRIIEVIRIPSSSIVPLEASLSPLESTLSPLESTLSPLGVGMKTGSEQ